LQVLDAGDSNGRQGYEDLQDARYNHRDGDSDARPIVTRAARQSPRAASDKTDNSNERGDAAREDRLVTCDGREGYASGGDRASQREGGPPHIQGDREVTAESRDGDAIPKGSGPASLEAVGVSATHACRAKDDEYDAGMARGGH
jgi:hypothetical protein